MLKYVPAFRNALQLMKNGFNNEPLLMLNMVQSTGSKAAAFTSHNRVWKQQQRSHHCFADPAKTAADESASKEILDTVNGMIASKNLGQTFAVVHIYGKQYLVHLGDILCLDKAVPVEIGEKIKLEKCLLLGNGDFSLIGRPLLNRDQVQVEATVIEKTMSQTFFNMESKPRSRGNRRYRFERYPQTMIRISDIKVCHEINETQQKIN